MQRLKTIAKELWKIHYKGRPLRIFLNPNYDLDSDDNIVCFGDAKSYEELEAYVFIAEGFVWANSRDKITDVGWFDVFQQKT